MKILMLVNWKIEYTNNIPQDKQPPDYYIKGEDYWFYRYFKEKPEVDVIDIRSYPWIEKFEKNKLRFYVIQAIRAIPKLHEYDLIISHGMQSGVVISLWRRFFKVKTRHIVFDIGSFASASETGVALKLMQFSSKSIDGIIYHTSSQIDYYQKFFPWIVEKSQFIRFGTDLNFFDSSKCTQSNDAEKYILCVGYSKRDWDTVVRAYAGIDTEIKLRFVGHIDEKYKRVKGVEQISFVPINELMNQIYNAKFCVLPLESFNYSYGQMTLLQQMALKKCVIAARVPSLVDYVEEGKTAILYEPKNIEDLRGKILELLQNESEIKRISDNTCEYLAEICNERIMAREIEEFIT